jgi:hypothetical protein
MKHLFTKSSKDFNDGGILIVWGKVFCLPELWQQLGQALHLSHSFLSSSWASAGDGY